MKVHQLLDRQHVVATIFRAIGQIRAIRSHRACHPQRRGMRVQRQMIGTRLHRQRYAASDQRLRLRNIQSACGKSQRRGLITGGDRALRTGSEVIAMHLIDQLRLLHQHARRPQRIVEIAAALLQLGGQRAIQHHIPVVLQGLAERRIGARLARKNRHAYSLGPQAIG